MTLPAPNLDDRRFQDLVDDAKRLVQERCPEWTDHNVHDPGVTLIELFAWLTDQILYRLNRVPDLNYVKFLELIGVTLFPPSPARCELTFRLTAPNVETVLVPAGTQVSSKRAEGVDRVTFTTEEDLAIVPSSVRHVASTHSDDHVHPHDDDLTRRAGFRAFVERPADSNDPPVPGEAFLIGLPHAVPSCMLRLGFDCRLEGIGVDPEDPPLGWEAWNGSRWVECELEADGTGGLNQAGDVLLHVPRSHQDSFVGNDLGGWLRCVVRDPRPRQPAYDRSPEIISVTAETLGASVSALHAEIVAGETVGLSNGLPAQRFRLQRRPVVFGREPPVLEVVTRPSTGTGDRSESQSDEVVDEWTLVTSFADSDEHSQHFMLDPAGGEVVLGPAVRERDGSLRHFGAVPPRDSLLRMRSYFTGGGPRGNVVRGALTVLHTPIPFINERVQNRRPAAGGVDGEDIENAKVRGPLLLRTGDRAVTAEDYRALAEEAEPSFARVECVPVDGNASPGAVRVLVVPAADAEDGRLRFEQLIPEESRVRAVARYLEPRRVIGVRISVEPPLYQGVTVVARISAEADADPARLRKDAVDALHRHFSPLAGGAGGDGWPFGRPVHAAEVFAVLQAVRGTRAVEEVLLFAADPLSGERTGPVDKIELPSHALAFPYEHRVMVTT
jgi:predicted phage baseplate assembly protein